MNLSMYTAATGAKAQQKRLDVISNNLANLQTDGYKSQRAGFVDLLYENYNRGAAKDPDTGSGSRVEKTDYSFEQGGLEQTGGKWDYAIGGSGFFAVYDMADEAVYYTRSGNFHLSNFGDDVFYLAAADGSLVMDDKMALISIIGGNNSEEQPKIGVFDFNNKEGMQSVGNNRYTPGPFSGQPYVREDAVLLQGKIEGSNVDLAEEMTKVIESQRAYQLTLKMVQTSDEVEQTINSLR